MKGLTAVQSLLLTVLALVILSALYYNVLSSLQGIKTSLDPFLRYARLAETYLKVVSSFYEVKNNEITIFLRVQNTFDEPIHYRPPLQAYVRASCPGGEQIFSIPLNNLSPVPFFQPKVLVDLQGSGPFDDNCTVVSAYLSINGVSVYFSPKIGSLFREPDAYCHDCITCQSLIDYWKSKKVGALIALDNNMEVNKDPCIVLSGDGNHLTFDCSGYSVVSSDGTFLEVNGSNYTVKGCVNVSGFSRAIHVISTSDVTVRTLLTDAPDVVYVEKPLFPSSYNIYLVDVAKGDRKIYQYRSGATTLYPPFLPLAVWIYDYSGPITLDLDNNVLDSVEPPLAIIGSSSLTVTDLNVVVSYPYAAVVMNSSDVTFSGGSVSNGSGTCALCVVDSTNVELNNLSISSSSVYDLNISSSDVELGDLSVG